MLNPTLLNALGYTSPFIKLIVDLAIGDTKDNITKGSPIAK